MVPSLLLALEMADMTLSDSLLELRLPKCSNRATESASFTKPKSFQTSWQTNQTRAKAFTCVCRTSAKWTCSSKHVIPACGPQNLHPGWSECQETMERTEPKPSRSRNKILDTEKAKDGFKMERRRCNCN